MAYNISLSNGDLLAIVDDGTADISSASIALVGKNFSGYGQYLNENFVHLTENFAGETAPANQLVGQLWYDVTNSELKVWNSTQWIAASKPTVVNDTVSTTPHFLTFSDAIAGAPQFKVSSLSGRGLVYIPSTGRFGLGTNLPEAKFVVSNNTSTFLSDPDNTTTIQTHGRVGEPTNVLIDSYGGSISTNDYSANNSSLIVLRRANGSNNSLESVKNNDFIGSLAAQAYNGSNYSSVRSRISFQAAENWTIGSNGTKVTFFVTPNGATTPVIAATLNQDSSAQFQGNIVGAANMNIAGTVYVAGSVLANGDITAYYTSDQRLKTNLQKIDNALDKVDQLEGITFNWNELATGKNMSVREAGLLAQQVNTVLPEAVSTRADGYMAVQYEKTIPLLIEAIKELKAEINQLKKTV
jgi:hypothetical protein